MLDKIYQTSQTSPDDSVVSKVSEVLLSEGVAIIPTDSVYGIACCILDKNDAHDRIFEIKKRPSDMKLPWLIADISQLDIYGINIPTWAYRLAHALWPGALTLIVQASDKVPQQYRAQDGTIALRIPNSNFVRELIRYMDCPLAATSANLHGNPSATSGSNLDGDLSALVDIVIDAGDTPVAIESTIVDCTKDAPVIVREGALSAPEIEVICSERSN